MDKTDKIMIVTVMVIALILGFLIGTLVTIPQIGSHSSHSICLLVEQSNELEEINQFAECLVLIKESDMFQKELYKKQWLGETD